MASETIEQIKRQILEARAAKDFELEEELLNKLQKVSRPIAKTTEDAYGQIF